MKDNIIRKCEYCNATSETERVSFVKKQNKFLCMRHESQLRKSGHIFNRTSKDKNEIIKYKDYAEIILYNIKQQEIARAKIDIDDVEKCKNYKWSLVRGKQPNGTPYAAACEKIEKDRYKRIRLHRLILNYDGPLEIDHINMNGLDNRKENLRIVDITTNRQNNKGLNIYKKKDRNKWEVCITRNKVTYYIGQYDNEKTALQKSIEAKTLYVENKELFMQKYNGSAYKRNSNKIIKDGDVA